MREGQRDRERGRREREEEKKDHRDRLSGKRVTRCGHSLSLRVPWALHTVELLVVSRGVTCPRGRARVCLDTNR